MRFLLALVLAVAAAVFVAVVIPFALVATAFWAADGSWEFEGRGLKYWMFVQGSRLERLGAVESLGPVKYSISLQEGTFPGWNVARYESSAPPEKVVSIYGERCSKLKFKVTENKQEPLRAEMKCEIEVYLDIEILAERAAGAETTKVFVKVWGSE